ncbi:MAG: SDR family NAD(P)-dependent oxidoreductase [Acidimicrobiia bacterium]
MDINGTSVLVTGASSGIGAELAPQLAAAGARKVTLVARRVDRLEVVAESVRANGAEPFIIAADLSDVARAEEVVHEAWDAMGGIDCLVNNAAVGKRKHVLDMRRDELEHVMTTNFLSPIQMAMVAIRKMLDANGGCIVNVGSMGGRIGIARESAYCAAKFAMSGWSEAAAMDLMATSVSIKLVLPGPIETEIWQVQPGELPGAYEGPFVSAADCATSIVEAIADDGFEYYVPAEPFPGFKQKDLVVGKTQNVDAMLPAMAKMADDFHHDAHR